MFDLHRARDELVHSITSSASASSLSGIWRPSALAVLRLITNSNLVACITGRSAGLAPFNPSNILNAELAVGVDEVGAVAHQPTERRVHSRRVHRWNLVARRQLDDHSAMACVGEACEITDEECAGLSLGNGREGLREIGVGLHFQNHDLASERLRRGQHLACQILENRSTSRAGKIADRRRLGSQFEQQTEPLAHQLGTEQILPSRCRLAD